MNFVCEVFHLGLIFKTARLGVHPKNIRVHHYRESSTAQSNVGFWQRLNCTKAIQFACKIAFQFIELQKFFIVGVAIGVRRRRQTCCNRGQRDQEGGGSHRVATPKPASAAAPRDTLLISPVTNGDIHVGEAHAVFAMSLAPLKADSARHFGILGICMFGLNKTGNDNERCDP